MKSSHPKSIGAFASTLVCCPLLAQAALISHESFSGYTEGLTGTAPAVNGFTGNWYYPHGSGNTLEADSLNYSDAFYPDSQGGRVVSSAAGKRISRNMSESLIVTSSTTGTLYLSFLFSGTNDYQALELHNGSQDDANRAFRIGIMSDNGLNTAQYGFGGNSLDTLTSTGANVVSGQAQLFVVKFDLSAEASQDSITVWVNPDLEGTGDPDGGATISGLDLAWNNMSLAHYRANGTAQWDEIRWGTDFASVTVVPEPSSAFLVGALGILPLLRRRRA